MLTKIDIEKYFVAEKQESLLFLIIGIIAITCSIILITLSKTNFWKGIAVPLILIGLIQVIVGYTVYNRCDADRANNVYAFDMNPQLLQQKELPRMEVVNKNFVLYRYIEISLVIIGLFLIVKCRNNAITTQSWGGTAFWYGLGISLVAQSLIMLGADYFAEKRAIIYTKQLVAFTKK
ncbi:MAG: hypothetical protein ACOVO1_08305 [Chitinophagaceae bacterium]